VAPATGGEERGGKERGGRGIRNQCWQGA